MTKTDDETATGVSQDGRAPRAAPTRHSALVSPSGGIAQRSSPRRRMKFAAYALLHIVVNALLRVTVGFQVTGRHNVPHEGPVLVVANHLHNFDPIVLSAALSRPVYYMAKRELFQHAFLRWVITNFGAFPINRNAIDRAALRQATHLLNEGLVVGLFPEGTRSLTGALGRVHPGVALLALQSNAPILPVGITGTEDLPFDKKTVARGHRRRRPRVRVTVGQPFTLPARCSDQKQDLPALTDQIMREVAALLPPAYSGVYAEPRN